MKFTIKILKTLGMSSELIMTMPANDLPTHEAFMLWLHSIAKIKGCEVSELKIEIQVNHNQG